MSLRTDIVVTTIWEPAWLQSYLDNLQQHGRESSVTLRIIGDRKTPATVWQCAQEARHRGFQIDCPTLDEQVACLKSAGLPDDFVPWNTDNRRNIGFLRAWQHGADVLISIDDDNYCLADADFVGAHAWVGSAAGQADGTLIAHGAPWFNLCSRLAGNCAATIYPRGFPYAARAGTQALLRPLQPDEAQRTIAINAGLWLDDPDVDAITRLALRPVMNSAASGRVVLDSGTWSPINTQNTALMRAAIPAYYYVPMGYSLQGMKIDRFGDILSGYFVQKCAKHLGHAVGIGPPVARHARTPHNLLLDLYNELAGIALVEDLLPWLQDLRLSGTNYPQAYAALAEALASEADRFRGFVWDQGGRDFLRATARSMNTWLSVVR
ncbi:MAG TPA: hypothetical protein VM240_07980 [Verrucomicrobiae bacterium]|nr:hypothetical protein [Verrucomicrobiae bacterium]